MSRARPDGITSPSGIYAELCGEASAVTAKEFVSGAPAMMQQAPAQMECIDLFAGAGGLSLGLAQAGFVVSAAVECDGDACKTFAATHRHTDLLETDIRALNFHKYRGIDLVAGGPPCQPFSSGGKRLGNADDRDLMPSFIRVIEEARPRAFLMENVPGLGTTGRASYFNAVLSVLRGLQYTVSSAVLNAADYGVPQKRRRLFVVGLLNAERQYEFPSPSHGPRGRKPHVNVGAVLDPKACLGEPNPSIIVYAKRPDLRPSPYDGHLFNGGGRPIDLDAPCHTILASAGGNKTHFLDTWAEVPQYHLHLLQGGTPRKGTLPGSRRLTVQESALIQTFPKSMKFSGSRSSQYTQVGNAVPPRLARSLGCVLKNTLNES
jgi:DNA (cytosine-5)-methyltransferase 1